MEDTGQNNQEVSIGIVEKPRKGRNKLLIALSAGLIVIIAGVAVLQLYKSSKSGPTSGLQSRSSKQTTAPNRFEEAVVLVTSDGFMPATITVKKGQPVTWRVEGDAIYQLAADPHPTHDKSGSLGIGPVLKNGESFTYSFAQSGEYLYHDEKNAEHAIGKVIVE